VSSDSCLQAVHLPLPLHALFLDWFLGWIVCSREIGSGGNSKPPPPMDVMIAAGVIVLSLIGLWIIDAVAIHLRYSLLDARTAMGRGRETLRPETLHSISPIPTKILAKQRLRDFSLSFSLEAYLPGLSKDLGIKNQSLYFSKIFSSSLRPSSRDPYRRPAFRTQRPDTAFLRLDCVLSELIFERTKTDMDVSTTWSVDLPSLCNCVRTDQTHRPRQRMSG
jgi:hypothetical protein